MAKKGTKTATRGSAVQEKPPKNEPQLSDDEDENSEDDGQDVDLSAFKANLESAIVREKQAKSNPSATASASKEEGSQASSSVADTIATASSDFPRGGAKPLTALEYRQVKSQAKEHALFEEHEAQPKKAVAEKTKAKPNAAQALAKRPKVEKLESVARISSREVEVGTLFLGLIKEITDYAIHVDLPCGLHGSIKLANINSAYMASLKLDEDGDDESEDDSVSKLTELFSVGKLIVCSVSSVNPDNHKIDLTTDPAVINSGVNMSLKKKGDIVYGCVRSKEDHGYVIDLGSTSLSGFVPAPSATEYCAKRQRDSLAVGEMLYLTLGSKTTGRVATLKIASDQKAGVLPEEDIEFGAILPGQTVTVKVKEVLENGLRVRFANIEATIDQTHLPTYFSSHEELTQAYSRKSTLTCKVLFVNNAEKLIALSARPDVIAGTITPTYTIEFGDVVNDLTVVRVVGSAGVEASLPSGGIAYIPFAHLKDLPETTKKADATKPDKQKHEIDKAFKVGTHHTGRCISLHQLDNVAIISLRKSVITQPFLRVTDVKVGDKVECLILEIIPQGVVVGLSSNVKGFCPKLHLSDNTKVKNVAALFKVGTSVNCRVLVNSVIGGKRQLIVTHKKSLIDSSLPVLSSYDDAIVGEAHHGFLTAVRANGCVVKFFNHIQAFIPRVHLSAVENITDPEKFFHLGQTVKAFVLSVDIAASRMLATLKPNMSQESTAAGLEVGSLVDVVVLAHTEKGLEVRLESDEKVKLSIAKVHLTDHPSLYDLSLSLYPVGKTIRNVLVLSKDSRNRVTLSLKSLIKEAFADSSAPRSISDMTTDRIYSAFIASITSFGCFVALPYGLIGVAGKAHLSNRFVTAPSDIYHVGQSVLTQVTEVDLEKSRLHFSLNEVKFSAKPDPLAYLTSYFAELDHLVRIREKSKIHQLLIGKLVEVTVKSIKDYGAVVTVEGGVDGLVTRDQMKGAQCVVGATYTARILDIDLLKNVVDLSLKPTLCSVSNPKIKVGQSKQGTIELVKDDYLVLSVDGALAFASTHSYNITDSPFAKFKSGQEGTAVILALKTLRNRNLASWESNATDATPKPSKKAESLIGSVSTATITAVLPNQINVTLASGLRGRVHVSEVVDTQPEDNSNVFEGFEKGQELTVRVIGVHDVARHPQLGETQIKTAVHLAECSLRPSVLASAEIESLEPKEGSTITAYVQSVDNTSVTFDLTPRVRARLLAFEAVDDVADIEKLAELYVLGSAHTLFVSKYDKRKKLILVSRPNRAKVAAGNIVIGIVDHIVANLSLRVQLASGVFGTVFITEISDTFGHQPLKAFTKGQVLSCYVISVNESKIALSLRQSKLQGDSTIVDPEIRSFSDVVENNVYHGYVQNVTGNGLYVILGADVVARVQICNISDEFIKDFGKEYHVGQRVRGRVLALDAEAKKCELSLKVSDILARAQLKFEDIKIGMKLSGKVTRVMDFGCFVSFDNSKLSALCHVSEITSEFVKDINTLISKDDHVKVVVLKIDSKTKKIAVGMKPSYFTTEDMQEEPQEETEQPVESASESESEAEEEVEQVEAKDLLSEVDAHSLKKSEAEPTGKAKRAKTTTSKPSEEPVAVPSTKTKKVKTPIVIEQEVDDDNDIPVVRKRKAQELENADRLSVSVGFSFEGDVAQHTTVVNSSDEEDELQTAHEKVTRKDKRDSKVQEEEDIRAREAQLMTGEATPQSPDEFDRLVLGSPNSSFLWIKYIAYYLKLTDIDKARDVAQRALKTISFRELSEKKNIWIALLNLENAYGNAETLQKTFKEAIQFHDSRDMHFQLVSIYERSGKNTEADTCYQEMCKNFRESKQVWLAYAAFLLKTGKGSQARELLQKALKSLPKRKHIETITKFAILEFKFGDAERGRTVFESVLSNYPKRVDLWSVYIDQEIRCGDHSLIRALFERVTSLQLSSKKMKFFFKRFLDFEKTEGNDATVQHVKDKARAFVATKTGDEA